MAFHRSIYQLLWKHLAFFGQELVRRIGQEFESRFAGFAISGLGGCIVAGVVVCVWGMV